MYIVETRVRVGDLIQLPQLPPKKPVRKQAAKVPSWHLTSPESMKFIEEAHARQTKKDQDKERKDKIKKEAVRNANKAARQAKLKKK